jgi:hypothetical protein
VTLQTPPSRTLRCAVASQPERAAPTQKSSDPLEKALTENWVLHATLDRMHALRTLASIVIALGATLIFALMAWVGQHKS